MQKILNELNRMLDRAIAQDNHRDYEALEAAMACVMRAPTDPSQRDATDTDRLNFLIHSGAAVESLDGGWALRFGPGQWQDGEYDTPREAIDAANAATRGME